MTGPYPPDHGTVQSEVTVTRDGDHVVVCGVRMTEEEAQDLTRRINGFLRLLEGERWQKERAAKAARWVDEAMAIVSYDGRVVRVRLSPSGVVSCDKPTNESNMAKGVAMLRKIHPDRKLWRLNGETEMWHIEGCGCSVYGRKWRLMSADFVAPKVCKRSALKLAAMTP